MVYGIIVAAGKSVRMGGPVPKQYQQLGNLPVLSHTLSAFDSCPGIDEIILVLPAGDLTGCRKRVIDPVSPGKKISPIAGGEKRQDSVYHGLLAVRDPEAIIVIHDGVRPFIQSRHIDACILGARETGAVVLGEPIFDTVKMTDITNIIKETVDREHMWATQTPQAFQYPLIKAAHDMAIKDSYTGTDDAVLLERLGTDVKMICGSRTNIKITTGVDLAIARAFIQEPDILQSS